MFITSIHHILLLQLNQHFYSTRPCPNINCTKQITYYYNRLYSYTLNVIIEFYVIKHMCIIHHLNVIYKYIITYFH